MPGGLIHKTVIGDRGRMIAYGFTIYIFNWSRIRVLCVGEKESSKNNDPMIVLDGTTYVTFYQKSPWR